MSPSQTIPAQDDVLAEEVAGWFLRMHESDCSEQTRCEFEAWLAADETHYTEYQQYQALWQNLDQLGMVPQRGTRKKVGAVLGIIAGLTVSLCAAQWYAERGEVMVTALGEHRHVVLADGTSVDMNTDSEIRVNMTDGLRKITLEKGEVLLAVARDSRPFEVHAREAVLRDIGTVFNVRCDPDTTSVAVLEGEVKVNLKTEPAIHLHGGQQVSYEDQRHSAIAVVSTADATAWLNGRLIFRDTPLHEVVSQINRYHSHRIELADAKLGSLKVSGEFNSADRAGLIAALKILLSLKSAEHMGATELSR